MAEMSPPLDASPPSRRTRWSRRVLPVVLAGYWILIFILTHLPAQDLPATQFSDKLAHFLAYGGLGGLLYLSAWILWPQWEWLSVCVWGLGLAYGAVDEWLQLLVGRDCELNDWLADAAAVTIAVIVLALVRGFFRRRAATAAARKQAAAEALEQAQARARQRREAAELQAQARRRENMET